MNKNYSSGLKQSGSTLLEVLVSVFIMGFGLLALVSMQLKTVMTAREAENQTIIAQATDSLIEGMMMNPTLSVEVLPGDDEIMRRSFADYLSNANLTASCTQDGILTSADALNTSKGINKQQLAAAQVCTFVKRLSSIPNPQDMKWTICREPADSSATKPTLDTAGNIQCSNSGTSAVLKVVWKEELEDGKSYKNTGLDVGTNAAGNAAVKYAYQATIGQ